MKIPRPLIALIAFLLPIVATVLWFYQGFYSRSTPVEAPDYINLSIPQPTLSTPIVQPTNTAPAKGVVAFDMNHSNNFSLSEIESLTHVLSDKGIKIDLINGDHDLAEHLKYVNAYIIISPLSSFSSEEILQISKFVARGGRLMVINDPTRSNGAKSTGFMGQSGGVGGDSGNSTGFFSATDISNRILVPYNIAFENDYVYNMTENEGNFRNVIYNTISESAITKGLKQVVLYGAHSIRTSENALIRGGENTLSSLNDKGGGLVVLAGDKDGRVLALGDLSFMSVPYNQVMDNQQFTLNIASFLMSGQQKAELDNLPYLFTRPVDVLVDADTAVDGKLLSLLSDVRQALKQMDLSVILTAKPSQGNDLLILDTIQSKKDLTPYLAGFNIQLPKGKDKLDKSPTKAPTKASTPTPVVPSGTNGEEPAFGGKSNEETVVIPGLGEFETAGIGVLLFSSTPEKNTLILLSSTEEDLSDFAKNILKDGDLTNCLVKDGIAVCKLSEGGSSNDSGDYSSGSDSGSGFDLGTEQPSTSETPSPQATATASG